MKGLRLDFCSHKAAKYAVMHWHYSRKMPNSKLVKVGVWEGGEFAGAIIYGSGANRHLARPFGLRSTQACELVRVALAPGRDHPTSKCVAISLKLLRRQSPGLRVVVSYADSGQGHIGTIYQAGNWFFLGASAQSYLKVLGELVHPRTIYDRYGPGGQSLKWLQANVDPNAERVPMEAKLKYAQPLDRGMRRKLAEMSKPYPKRLGSIDSDAPTAQVGDDGASPIPRLHSSLDQTSRSATPQQQSQTAQAERRVPEDGAQPNPKGAKRLVHRRGRPARRLPGARASNAPDGTKS